MKKRPSKKRSSEGRRDRKERSEREKEERKRDSIERREKERSEREKEERKRDRKEKKNEIFKRDGAAGEIRLDRRQLKSVELRMDNTVDKWWTKHDGQESFLFFYSARHRDI